MFKASSHNSVPMQKPLAHCQPALKTQLPPPTPLLTLLTAPPTHPTAATLQTPLPLEEPMRIRPYDLDKLKNKFLRLMFVIIFTPKS